ncbi:hypothetical protein [Streptomyces sp. NPDC048659]|uniref:hypothetical protein n=1 Tax=Streptomyces sp. NPDC048659 TaxID=3155489 RepID=UPI003425B09E
MKLSVGGRVRLAADLVFDGSLTLAPRPAAVDMDPADDVLTSEERPTPGGASLALAAGLEGTVENVVAHEKRPSHEVTEYLRLKSLLDSYGEQMPEASRTRLEEQIAELKPEWAAYERHTPGVTVRVRLDNGFVVDDAPEGYFVS